MKNMTLFSLAICFMSFLSSNPPGGPPLEKSESEKSEENRVKKLSPEELKKTCLEKFYNVIRLMRKAAHYDTGKLPFASDLYATFNAQDAQLYRQQLQQQFAHDCCTSESCKKDAVDTVSNDYDLTKKLLILPDLYARALKASQKSGAELTQEETETLAQYQAEPQVYSEIEQQQNEYIKKFVDNYLI